MKVERTILVVSKVSVLAPHRMHGEGPMHVVAKRPVGRPHTLHSGFQLTGCSKERTLITWSIVVWGGVKKKDIRRAGISLRPVVHVHPQAQLGLRL